MANHRVVIAALSLLAFGCAREKAAQTSTEVLLRYDVAYEDVASNAPKQMLFIDSSAMSTAGGSREPGEFHTGIPRPVAPCHAPPMQCYYDARTLLPVLIGGMDAGESRTIAAIGATVKFVGPSAQSGCADYQSRVRGDSRVQNYTICRGLGVSRITIYNGPKVEHDFVLKSHRGLLAA